MSNDRNDRPPIAVDGAELARALMQAPPGRTLAGEFLRLRAYVSELGKQVVRGTELRIEAEKRAGKRNVGRLEERIATLEHIQEYLVSVVQAAPWKSCAHLQQALQAELPEYYDAGGSLDSVRELFDVDLEQERSPDSVARLKAAGLLP